MASGSYRISPADAPARLRSHAYAQDRNIDEIAAKVVARTLRLDDQAD